MSPLAGRRIPNQGRGLRVGPSPVSPHLPHDARRTWPGLSEVVAGWGRLPASAKAEVLAIVRRHAEPAVRADAGNPTDEHDAPGRPLDGSGPERTG